jgi:hypothetical protein
MKEKELSSADMEKIDLAVKAGVHAHGRPGCAHGKHHDSCEGRGPEAKCVRIPIPGHNNDVWVCLHI